MRVRRQIGAAAVVGALTIGSSAHANLVTNGDFETGNFSGWTVSGTVDGNTSVRGAGFSGYNPNSGNFFAALGAVGSDNILSQALATTAGRTYDVSFFLAANGTSPSDFTLKFDGVVLFSVTNPASTFSQYVNHDFQVMATQSGSVLEIDSRNDPSFIALDDVSVNPVNSVPEPTTLAAFGTGLVWFGWRRRRRAR
jgi:hypothetical protein